MFAGLIFSRALLSISMIAFVICILILEKGYARWKEVKKDPLNWLPAFLILPVLVSYPWSANTQDWTSSLIVKLPLVLPLVLSLAKTNATDWRSTSRLFSFIMLLGIVWSVYAYFSAGTDGSIYLQGQVIAVPMYNDHVRFSWAVALVWLFLLDDWWRDRTWWAGALAVLIAIYIHWMGARTGVLYFYLVSLLFLVAKASAHWRRILPFFLFMPLLAWLLFPSFSNKIRYMVWDFQNYSRGNYVSGLSDQNRIRSARAAVDIFAERPFQGVGFGDVDDEKERWYDTKLPAVRNEDRVAVPGSLLWYAAGAGAGALALASYVLFLPVCRLSRNGDWFLPAGFFLMSGFQALYEPFLELQFGVFLYAFFGPLVWRRYKNGTKFDR